MSRLWNHSRPQRPRSFWSAPRITTSGQVPWDSGSDWLCRQNRMKPEPTRFVRIDYKHAQSDGKFVNRGTFDFGADQKERELWGQECYGIIWGRHTQISLCFDVWPWEIWAWVCLVCTQKWGAVRSGLEITTLVVKIAGVKNDIYIYVTWQKLPSAVNCVIAVARNLLLKRSNRFILKTKCSKYGDFLCHEKFLLYRRFIFRKTKRRNRHKRQWARSHFENYQVRK